jgi:hypothetical protein
VIAKGHASEPAVFSTTFTDVILENKRFLILEILQFLDVSRALKG